MRAGVAGLVVSTAATRARFLPFGEATLVSEAGLDRKAALALLKPVLEDAAIPKVGHDLKFAAVALGRLDVALAGIELDTMLAAYLLDAARSSQDLEPVALEQLGYKALTADDVRGKGAKSRRLRRAAAGRVARLRRRARRPVVAAGRALPPRAGPGRGRRRLPRSRAAADARSWPASSAPASASTPVSSARRPPAWSRSSATLAAEIHRLAGEPFNIGSPKQLGEILFEKLKLPVLKRTGTTRTPSTAVEVLEELALTHDLPRLILEWRSLSKLKGTYIDALPTLVHPVTGRVHTVFNQAVAATGRLSSSDPNLQNIPIRTAIGREIRRAFVADPGHVLISADYSQIELRVLAHLSGDETLTDGVRPRRRHPRPDGAEGVRRQQRPRPPRAAAARQDRQLRAALRQDRVHAVQGHRRVAAGRAAVHRGLLRRLPARARVHRRPPSRKRAGQAWCARCSDASGRCRS